MDLSAIAANCVVATLGRFPSDELEEAYRAGERAHDVRIVRFVALIAIAAGLAFGILDYVVQRDSPFFHMLLVARFTNVAVAVLAFLLFRRLESSRARDRMLLAWAGWFALTGVPIALARPLGLGVPLAGGLVLVFSFALVLPASFRHQVAAVSCVVAAFIAVRVAQGQVGAALVSTTGLFAVAVALSLLASLRSHRNKRELFLALHEQRKLHEQLEVALAEIRTLRGIVPICAFCHKIRDDDGAWHRVEVYVTKHTHAEFSHGFCPDCEEANYPD